MSLSKKKSSGFLPQTLDVDDSIIDQNLKIVENKSFDDNITGLFPGLVNNANASTAKHYKNDRKLLPTEDYPTVQVFNTIKFYKFSSTRNFLCSEVLSTENILIIGYPNSGHLRQD